MRHLLLVAPLSVACFIGVARGATAQAPKQQVIPHGQSQPPGPPLSPADAIKKMQVPPGFSVELVAAEPDLVNPVAMTFDEKGRIWITESVEYPRHSPGPGKDRVKVLESTKGDGKYDKVTTVIDGLNIPSGIAVGHGGVWVANSPDILFYPFDDREKPKLGKPQVVVTGFGRVGHARAAQLADLGAGRMALWPQRRFQPKRRQAGRQGMRTSPARCSASIRRRRNSTCSARGRAIRGASLLMRMATPSCPRA